jgi:hypothetical protein
MPNYPNTAPTYRPKHVRRVTEDPTRSMAKCTGGLKSPMGKTLRPCRSGVCAHHNPVNYSEYMARHATDSV